MPQELGCKRTLNIFLSNCNPWAKTLNLTKPTWRQRHFWSLRITGERFYPQLERLTGLLWRAPSALFDTIKALPWLWQAGKELHNFGGLEQCLKNDHKLHYSVDSNKKPMFALTSGIRLGTQLLRIILLSYKLNIFEVRVLATFKALRAKGYNVEVVCGKFSKQQTNCVYWLEYNGHPIPYSGDLNTPSRYPVKILLLKD